MAEPTPFVTDGCSGGMSWIWRRVLRRPPPWEHACVSHDVTYWLGGTAAERRHADAMLAARVCMNGYPLWAFVMWVAVRVGGHPLLPLPWRWGYAHAYPTGYRANQSVDQVWTSADCVGVSKPLGDARTAHPDSRYESEDE